MLMISAPPSLLPWTTERETFLRQFYPSFPIPSNQNCTSFSTIDTSSIRESPQLHVTRPMNQISFKPSATNTLSSPTFQTNDTTTNHSLQHASSILDPKLLPNNITNVSYRQLKHVLGPDTFENTGEFWTNCFKLLSDSAEVLEKFCLTLNEFLVNQKTVSKRKNPIVNMLLHLLLHNLFGNAREDIQISIQCLLSLSNPKDLIVKLRQLTKCPFMKASILPSRLELETVNSRLHKDFRSILNPSRTPTGFRVNLIKFVKFVACNLYKKTTLSGVRVDIYGDAMSRGNRDVVRMAFRILDSGIESEQSSTHVFTFAVFDVSYVFTK